MSRDIPHPSAIQHFLKKKERERDAEIAEVLSSDAPPTPTIDRERFEELTKGQPPL